MPTRGEGVQKTQNFADVIYGWPQGGKVLFWSPFGSKSTKICYMPMLEELARRGHEITIVHPNKAKQSTKGISEILSSDKVDEFLNNISK